MATFGAEKKEGETAPQPQFTFGSAAAGGVSFGGADSKPFSLDAKSSLFGASIAETTNKVEKFGESQPTSTEAKEDEGDVEQESTQEFTPVVQLEEVEVKTMEEDEEIMFKMRARLYRFAETLLNKGSGTKEWIERGVGEVKLLKHRESSKIRVLMRQERTMKVIVNHVADPRITLQPNVGNDKSWVWSAFDFSEGELVEEVFAIKFANAENAGKFKDAFIDAQEKMTAILAGEDGPPDQAADDAADALANLNTSEETPPKDE